jgi:hypothetical protein
VNEKSRRFEISKSQWGGNLLPDPSALPLSNYYVCRHLYPSWKFMLPLKLLYMHLPYYQIKWSYLNLMTET